jgi:hypothetical protein
MPDPNDMLITLPADAMPEALRSWLVQADRGALLVSLELLPDGRVMAEGLPDVDPSLVVRVRRTMAQYEDVLRRLT